MCVLIPCVIALHTHRDRLENAARRYRYARIDGVLGDVPLDAAIVAFAGIPELGERTMHRLELARSPPCPRDDLAYASHRLRVGTDHGNRARVLKDVFGGDRLRTNPRFCEAEIFEDRSVEVVTDHKHLSMAWLA